MKTKNARRRGRPKKLLTAAQISAVERWAAQGVYDHEICTLLGIPKRTFEKRKADQEELAAAIARGRAMGHAEASSILAAKCRDGNIQALLYYLARKCGWTERQKIESETKTEVNDVSKPKANVQIVIDPDKMTMDEIKELMAGLPEG